MTDPLLIDECLRRGTEARKKVEAEFRSLSLQQLNWKPQHDSWSIAQCLEHLIIADGLYFHVLKKISEGTYKKSLWEKLSPFSSINEGLLKSSMREQVDRPYVTPPVFRPTMSNLTNDILDRYLQNLETFLGFINACKNINLDSTVLTSPALAIITYRLRFVFEYLMQHEHRHINQAIRVKLTPEFPQG